MGCTKSDSDLIRELSLEGGIAYLLLIARSPVVSLSIRLIAAAVLDITGVHGRRDGSGLRAIIIHRTIVVILTLLETTHEGSWNNTRLPNFEVHPWCQKVRV